MSRLEPFPTSLDYLARWYVGLGFTEERLQAARDLLLAPVSPDRPSSAFLNKEAFVGWWLAHDDASLEVDLEAALVSAASRREAALEVFDMLVALPRNMAGGGTPQTLSVALLVDLCEESWFAQQSHAATSSSLDLSTRALLALRRTVTRKRRKRAEAEARNPLHTPPPTSPHATAGARHVHPAGSSTVGPMVPFDLFNDCVRRVRGYPIDPAARRRFTGHRTDGVALEPFLASCMLDPTEAGSAVPPSVGHARRMASAFEGSLSAFFHVLFVAIVVTFVSSGRHLTTADDMTSSVNAVVDTGFVYDLRSCDATVSASKFTSCAIRNNRPLSFSDVRTTDDWYGWLDASFRRLWTHRTAFDSSASYYPGARPDPSLGIESAWGPVDGVNVPFGAVMIRTVRYDSEDRTAQFNLYAGYDEESPLANPLPKSASRVPNRAFSRKTVSMRPALAGSDVIDYAKVIAAVDRTPTGALNLTSASQTARWLFLSRLLRDAFVYRSCGELHTYSMLQGQTTNYPCDGYALIIPFSLPLCDALTLVAAIHELNWVDGHCGLVATSYAFVNVNEPMFLLSARYAEVGAGDDAWRPFQRHLNGDFFIWAVEDSFNRAVTVMFAVAVVFYGLRVIYVAVAAASRRVRLLAAHGSVFAWGSAISHALVCDGWLMLSFVNVGVFIAAATLRLVILLSTDGSMVTQGGAAASVDTSWNSPISAAGSTASSLFYYDAATSNTTTNYVSGYPAGFEFIAEIGLVTSILDCVNIAIVSVELLSFLRHSFVMTVLVKTLSEAFRHLVGVAVSFVTFFFGFVIAAHVMFGNLLRTYSTIEDTAGALIRALTGDIDYNDLRNAIPFVGPIFFALFYVALILLILNMVVAVLNKSFEDSTEGQAAPLTVDLVVQEVLGSDQEHAVAGGSHPRTRGTCLLGDHDASDPVPIVSIRWWRQLAVFHELRFRIVQIFCCCCRRPRRKNRGRMRQQEEARAAADSHLVPGDEGSQAASAEHPVFGDPSGFGWHHHPRKLFQELDQLLTTAHYANAGVLESRAAILFLAQVLQRPDLLPTEVRSGRMGGLQVSDDESGNATMPGSPYHPHGELRELQGGFLGILERRLRFLGPSSSDSRNQRRRDCRRHAECAFMFDVFCWMPHVICGIDLLPLFVQLVNSIEHWNKELQLSTAVQPNDIVQSREAASNPDDAGGNSRRSPEDVFSVVSILLTSPELLTDPSFDAASPFSPGVTPVKDRLWTSQRSALEDTTLGFSVLVHECVALEFRACALLSGTKAPHTVDVQDDYDELRRFSIPGPMPFHQLNEERLILGPLLAGQPPVYREWWDRTDISSILDNLLPNESAIGGTSSHRQGNSSPDASGFCTPRGEWGMEGGTASIDGLPREKWWVDQFPTMARKAQYLAQLSQFRALSFDWTEKQRSMMRHSLPSRLDNRRLAASTTPLANKEGEPQADTTATLAATAAFAAVQTMVFDFNVQGTAPQSNSKAPDALAALADADAARPTTAIYYPGASCGPRLRGRLRAADVLDLYGHVSGEPLDDQRAGHLEYAASFNELLHLRADFEAACSSTTAVSARAPARDWVAFGASTNASGVMPPTDDAVVPFDPSGVAADDESPLVSGRQPRRRRSTRLVGMEPGSADGSEGSTRRPRTATTSSAIGAATLPVELITRMCAKPPGAAGGESVALRFFRREADKTSDILSLTGSLVFLGLFTALVVTGHVVGPAVSMLQGLDHMLESGTGATWYMESGHPRRLSVNDVGNSESLYSWISQVVIGKCFSPAPSAAVASQPQSVPLVADGGTRVFGAVKVRQQRIAKSECAEGAGFDSEKIRRSTISQTSVVLPNGTVSSSFNPLLGSSSISSLQQAAESQAFTYLLNRSQRHFKEGCSGTSFGVDTDKSGFFGPMTAIGGAWATALPFVGVVPVPAAAFLAPTAPPDARVLPVLAAPDRTAIALLLLINRTIEIAPAWMVDSAVRTLLQSLFAIAFLNGTAHPNGERSRSLVRVMVGGDVASAAAAATSPSSVNSWTAALLGPTLLQLAVNSSTMIPTAASLSSRGLDVTLSMWLGLATFNATSSSVSPRAITLSDVIAVQPLLSPAVDTTYAFAPSADAATLDPTPSRTVGLWKATVARLVGALITDDAEAYVTEVELRAIADAFRYRTEAELSAFGQLFSREQVYNGDGYAVFLPLNVSRQEASRTLAWLEILGWVDRQTRFIAVEYVGFNFHQDLFVFSSIVFKTMAGGAWYLERYGLPFSVFSASTAPAWFVALLVIFIISWLGEATAHIQECVRQHTRLVSLGIHPAWSIVKVLILDPWSLQRLVANLIVGASTIVRVYVIGRGLADIDVGRDGTFPSLAERLARLNQVSAILDAFATLLVYTRVFYFFRWVPAWGVTTKTLTKAAGDVAAIVFSSLALLAGFVLSAYVLFGDTTESYASIVNSISSLLLIVFLGSSADDEMVLKDQRKPSYTAFYVLFIVSCKLVLLNLIVAVLTNGFEAANESIFDTARLWRIVKGDPMFSGEIKEAAAWHFKASRWPQWSAVRFWIASRLGNLCFFCTSDPSFPSCSAAGKPISTAAQAVIAKLLTREERLQLTHRTELWSVLADLLTALEFGDPMAQRAAASRILAIQRATCIVMVEQSTAKLSAASEMASSTALESSQRPGTPSPSGKATTGFPPSSISAEEDGLHLGRVANCKLTTYVLRELTRHCVLKGGGDSRADAEAAARLLYFAITIPHVWLGDPISVCVERLLVSLNDVVTAVEDETGVSAEEEQQQQHLSDPAPSDRDVEPRPETQEGATDDDDTSASVEATLSRLESILSA